MASVIHGFMYNKDAFSELGLEVPETTDEFYAVLDAIKEDGGYIPLAMGTKDQWEAATMGYTNIGPAYWNGEEGRNALIAGDAKLTRRALRRGVPRAREVDTLPRQRLPGAGLHRQPEPVHARARGDLPDGLVGDHGVPGERGLRTRAPSRRRRRRRTAPATSAITPTSASA